MPNFEEARHAKYWGNQKLSGDGNWIGNARVTEWGGQFWVGNEPVTHYGGMDWVGNRPIKKSGGINYVGQDRIF